MDTLSPTWPPRWQLFLCGPRKSRLRGSGFPIVVPPSTSLGLHQTFQKPGTNPGPRDNPGSPDTLPASTAADTENKGTWAQDARREKHVTEAVFDFIQRSRKMIVVLSPDYLLEKSISMLEFKLGLLCQNHIATKLVVVEHRPLLRAPPSVQQLRESVAFVAWKGERSKRPGSKFWKALRLALPLRSLSATASAWNESGSSHSDVSLDHAQKKKGRLKGQAEEQGARPGLPVQRGLAPLPRVKAKGHPKPFLACRCCVVSCNGNHGLRGHSHRGGKATWGAQQARKPPAGEPKGPQLQSSTAKRPPAASPAPPLGLHQYTDLSNNNDFYVL
ncbi:UNVERIFIED_CONTAM: hypothetical protein K2H54_065402 [Gekko kuhli]